MREEIQVGYQAFVSDGGEEFGAVRQVSPNGGSGLVIYVENAGDFYVPLDAVAAVHSQKVIFECRKLDTRACGVRSVMPTTPRSLILDSDCSGSQACRRTPSPNEVGEAAGAVTA
jgi:hypothetical protein